MKKYNLFKVLAITVLVAWLLTLFIPGSYADYSGNITTNSIAAVGVWSLLSNLSISISYFNAIAVFLIAVACFYAVLRKIEVYNNFVKKVASIFKNKERLLLAITIIVFGLLSCVVSDWMILIVFIPFVYMVMNELKIDKKVILSSTVVASIIGAMCGIYNSTLFSMLGLKVNTLLLVKIILLVISLVILISFSLSKKVIVKNEEIKKSTKVNSKKNDTIKKVVSTKTKKQTTKKATTRKKVAK